MPKLMCQVSLLVAVLFTGACEPLESSNSSRSRSRRSSEFPEDAIWIDGRNISDWPVTINLRSVTLYPAANGVHHHVSVDYDRLQEIPAWNVPGDPNNVHNVNGNIWLIREYEGQWYIGTVEYLRVGQTYKEVAASPAFKFMPQPGDRLGFMVSTTARIQDGTIADGVTYRERSNVYWTIW